MTIIGTALFQSWEQYCFMKAWSDFTIIYNEHVFVKSDGAMAMRIDIVRHLLFQHLFPHRAERADN